MAAVLLGVLIAASFGTGDFVGGRASKSASAVAVLAVAQVCSVAGALALALVVPGDVVVRDVALGAVAGAVNVAGLCLLYDGLARHAAAVVAPVAAVVGSSVPVGWGLLQGERPSAVVLAGIVIAIMAGAVIALEGGQKGVGVAGGAARAVVAGAALGSSLVLFSETSTQSGQWPVLSARAAALVAVSATAAVLVSRGGAQLPTGRARWLALAAGAFDVAATGLLVYSVREELLVVVAPIVSLAPSFTVVLAWAVDRERLQRVQAAGLVLAVAGLALIAGG